MTSLEETFQKLQESFGIFGDTLEHFEFDSSDTLVYRFNTEKKPQEFIEATLDKVIQKYVMARPLDTVEYSVHPHRVISHSGGMKAEITEITGPMTYDIMTRWILKDRRSDVRRLLQNLNPDSTMKIDWYFLD